MAPLALTKTDVLLNPASAPSGVASDASVSSAVTLAARSIARDMSEPL